MALTFETVHGRAFVKVQENKQTKKNKSVRRSAPCAAYDVEQIDYFDTLYQTWNYNVVLKISDINDRTTDQLFIVEHCSLCTRRF